MYPILDDSSEERRGHLWHFDKTINFSSLLAYLTTIVVVTIFIMRMDTRIQLVEIQLVNDKERFIAAASLLKENFLEIKVMQTRIEDKLSGKQDRQAATSQIKGE